MTSGNGLSILGFIAGIIFLVNFIIFSTNQMECKEYGGIFYKEGKILSSETKLNPFTKKIETFYYNETKQVCVLNKTYYVEWLQWKEVIQ